MVETDNIILQILCTKLKREKKKKKRNTASEFKSN